MPDKFRVKLSELDERMVPWLPSEVSKKDVVDSVGVKSTEIA